MSGLSHQPLFTQLWQVAHLLLPFVCAVLEMKPGALHMLNKQ